LIRKKNLNWFRANAEIVCFYLTEPNHEIENRNRERVTQLSLEHLRKAYGDFEVAARVSFVCIV
tara:strand:+ start:579 stop:770 length:192 start_codon:yes stop_codon:yes gene_type:complete